MQVIASLLTKLNSEMAKAGDNHGVQLKLNADAQWGATVGLRLNHVRFQGILRYLSLVHNALYCASATQLLEHESVGHCYSTHPTTHRKRRRQGYRTVYVTLKPKSRDYLFLKDALPHAVNTYQSLDAVLPRIQRLAGDSDG